MMLVSLSPPRVYAPMAWLIFSSLRNLLIHTLSLAVWPSVIYSASVVEVDTVRCFLLHQETTAPFDKETMPHYRFSVLGVAGVIAVGVSHQPVRLRVDFAGSVSDP